MHSALSVEASNDWWFDDKKYVSHRYAMEAVKTAKQNVQGRTVVPGDVIAGVSFGFWRGMYHDRYEQLWRSIVYDVFPDIPASQAKRKLLSSKMEKFRRLRNRVAHHEPIFHWQDLKNQHDEFCELPEWLCGETRRELRLLKRFTTVHKRKPTLNR